MSTLTPRCPSLLPSRNTSATSLNLVGLPLRTDHPTTTNPCCRFWFSCETNVRSPQDALELPCVQAALSRVNLAVLSASEGLYEASAGGGVLLMGNRVAHPISQVNWSCALLNFVMGVRQLERGESWTSIHNPPIAKYLSVSRHYHTGGVLCALLLDHPP